MACGSTLGNVFDTIFGLPVHTLVIHAVVALVPLSAVGVLLYVLVPTWRDVLRWPVLVVATLGTAATPVAYFSGRELKARLGLTTTIEHHQTFGTRTLFIVLVWWVLIVIFWSLTLPMGRLESRYRSASHSSSGKVSIVAGLLVVASLVVLGAVIATGHSGSTVVWKPIVDSTN